VTRVDPEGLQEHDPFDYRTGPVPSNVFEGTARSRAPYAAPPETILHAGMHISTTAIVALTLLGGKVASAAAEAAAFEVLGTFASELDWSFFRKNSLTFRGMEVRNVNNLSHIPSEDLIKMFKSGTAGTAPCGEPIVLHHHKQQPGGPIIEMKKSTHTTSNKNQHPLGTSGGVGSGKTRKGFNSWRKGYWRSRAAYEILRRLDKL